MFAAGYPVSESQRTLSRERVSLLHLSNQLRDAVTVMSRVWQLTDSRFQTMCMEFEIPGLSTMFICQYRKIKRVNNHNGHGTKSKSLVLVPRVPAGLVSTSLTGPPSLPSPPGSLRPSSARLEVLFKHCVPMGEPCHPQLPLPHGLLRYQGVACCDPSLCLKVTSSERFPVTALAKAVLTPHPGLCWWSQSDLACKTQLYTPLHTPMPSDSPRLA